MATVETKHLIEQITHGTKNLPLSKYKGVFSAPVTQLYIHWHNEMELIYIQEGEGTLHLDLIQYPVVSGDFIQIQKQALHYLAPTSNKPLIYEVLVFDLSMLTTLFSDYTQTQFINPLLQNTLEINPVISKTQPGYHHIITIFKTISQQFDLQPVAYELEIKGLLFLLFSTLYRENYLTQTKTNRANQIKQIKALKAVLSHIQTAYKEEMTIEQLAFIAGYSHYHFIRLFKKHLQMTPIEYINHIRLEEALKLLTNTELSITQVAFEVGYDDVSYFIKNFKKKYESTPLQYKHSIKHLI